MEFDICISHNWHGETIAFSESKARSNLIYQFKKKTNRIVGSKISLPGQIKKIDI